MTSIFLFGIITINDFKKMIKERAAEGTFKMVLRVFFNEFTYKLVIKLRLPSILWPTRGMYLQHWYYL